ncbi:hypothetical protein [Teredinibacter haidensis]|uniref:hypothetical protein n=1 Tax=Teredinibacter haidensis TaxID=2731755 RepID=UPI0009491047|nr:hypothetical protein [Teredinibacter haidensis]
MKMMSIFFLLMFVSISSSAECTFSFQVDSGAVYDQDDINKFVVSEVRSRLSRSQSMFDTKVHRNCDSNSDTVVLNMEAVALYIHSINGVDLADDVERYTDDEAILSFENFNKAFDDALEFASLNKKRQQNVVKSFAFVIAESARFEDVDKAVIKIFSTACSYKWSDYMDMLRRWKTISIFVNSQGLVKGLPSLGGWRAFLIAPITSEQVEHYNKATEDGWKVVRWKYGEPRIQDKASPLSTGTASCSAI